MKRRALLPWVLAISGEVRYVRIALVSAASLVLIAIGAILRYAVTDHISGIDLTTVGLILLIVGIVGLVLSLIMYMSATRTRGGVVERTEYRAGDPTDPRY